MPDPKGSTPMTEIEFQRLMERVDLHLIDDGTPIQERQIKGWMYAAELLGIELQFGGSRAPADNLSSRIFNWFDQRYGDKLKINFDIGRSFVIIRNDAWIMTYPKIYGRINLIVSPDIPSDPDKGWNTGNKLHKYNVLDSIEGLPDGLIKVLNKDEGIKIFKLFIKGHECFNYLNGIKSYPFVNEVISDLEASVLHATNHPPHFAQSKWSSLQATEKILKSYLRSNGAKFPKNHNLRALVTRANKTGLFPIDKEWINSVQCTANTRYGEEPVTLVQAWSAHWNTIYICSFVAKSILETKAKY